VNLIYTNDEYYLIYHHNDPVYHLEVLHQIIHYIEFIFVHQVQFINLIYELDQI